MAYEKKIVTRYLKIAKEILENTSKTGRMCFLCAERCGRVSDLRSTFCWQTPKLETFPSIMSYHNMSVIYMDALQTHTYKLFSKRINSSFFYFRIYSCTPRMIFHYGGKLCKSLQYNWPITARFTKGHRRLKSTGVPNGEIKRSSLLRGSNRGN